jgi:hypothetical protein
MYIHRKRLLIVFLSGLLLLFASPLVIYFYQDEIVNAFTDKITAQLDNKISIGTASISVYKKFPRISIALDSVVIAKDPAWPKDYVAKIKTLYFTFDFFDIINKRYHIKSIQAENGYINLIHYKNEKKNYDIFGSKKDDKKTEDNSFAFNLNAIKLKNIEFEFSDKKTKSKYVLSLQDVKASLTYSDKLIKADLNGKLTTNEINTGTDKYFAGKALSIDGGVEIYQQAEKIIFKKVEVGVEKASFYFDGGLSYGKNAEVNFQYEGKNADMQTLTSLAPESVSLKLADYRTKGEVYFKGSTVGKIAETPLTIVEFGCKEASFFHPDVAQSVENISFEGFYTNGQDRSNTSSEFSVKGLTCKIAGNPLSGNIVVKNFENPDVNCDLIADLDLAALVQLYPFEGVEELSGSTNLKIQFNGNINEVIQRKTEASYQNASEITFQNVVLKIKDMPYKATIEKGKFYLEGRSMRSDELKIFYGTNDIAATLSWENFLQYLVKDNELMKLNVAIQSDNLNITEMMNSAPKTNGEKSVAQKPVVFLPFENSSFTLNLKSVIYDKHHLTDFTGNIYISDPYTYRLEPVTFKTCDGKVEMKAAFEAKSEGQAVFEGSYDLAGINVQKLLSSFDNFGQNTIKAEQVEGLLTGIVEADVYFDANFQPKNELLKITAEMHFANGRLKNLSSLEKMSKFLKNRDFNDIKFSEIENTFIIANNQLEIPRMLIESNVGSIYVSGKQGFDGTINYHLQIPLSTFKRNVEELQNEAIEQTGEQASLFLKITGTTDNFKVGYDTEAVARKLKATWQKQKENFKKLFKKDAK